jgi:hypothetical protein
VVLLLVCVLGGFLLLLFLLSVVVVVVVLVVVVVVVVVLVVMATLVQLPVKAAYSYCLPTWATASHCEFFLCVISAIIKLFDHTPLLTVQHDTSITACS